MANPLTAAMSGTLTEPRNFNLMMKTAIGPMEDSASQAYLRPETAQGIFVNFKNIYQSARKRPPFGIAQIGCGSTNSRRPSGRTMRKPARTSSISFRGAGANSSRSPTGAPTTSTRT